MPESTLKLQRPYTDEEARENLRDFIDADDRDPPPIFVGREEIMDRVRRDVVRCRSNSDPDTCFTIVIQGAPGCGKTSLLSQIKNLLGSREDDSGVGHPVAAEKISGSILSSAETVANRLIRAYSGRHLEVQKEEQTTVSGGAGPSWLSLRRQKTAKVKRLQDQIRDAGVLWQSVIDNTSVDLKDTVCLLLIDESQNIEGSNPNAPAGRNTIATTVHEGFGSTGGLKIVPVFAGLSDTESVLADRGISRLPRSSSIHLGSLTQDETEELVSKWMRHDEFGFEDLFSDADIRRVSQMIAVASEGWPRHANGYLAELARSVLEHGDGDELTIDLNEVFERGHDDRLAYYQKRLTTAKLGGYARAIRDAAQRSTDGIVELATLQAIAEENYRIPSSEVFALHDKALHAGVLEPAMDGDEERFKFPIPSFFTYMHLGRDLAKFNAKMREQLIEHSHLWSESTDGVPH